MKKFLCIIMAFVMIFSLAACGKKIVVNKKPHVEAADRVYDKTEIIALEESYEYCGMEYELYELMDVISLDYNGSDTYNIVCKEKYQTYADSLALSLEEMEIKYTINGENPDEDTSEEETTEIIAE